ncbi:MAG: polyribonucleotide nucleotidyltransferase, partial [Planctomycetota bacterium]|nr:polyribonucleotide nucleotidyltransferase [Planctomycetota bacterium]
MAVDYREKTYAAGKFPGGFFKREKAPSVKEIVTMRLADRPLRPLFPDGYRQEVIIQSIVLSADMENDPDILSIIGASAALHLSHIPFQGPVGAVRIGRQSGAFLINPTIAQTDAGELNLVLAGTARSVTMVEASASELREDEMIAAIALGQETVKVVVEMQEELRAKVAAPAKENFVSPPPPACLPQVAAAVAGRLEAALLTPGKCGRREAVRALREEIVAALAKPSPEAPTADEVKAAFDLLQAETIRRMVKEGRRVDRRDLRAIRPIDCRVGILPRVHGSALFTRGETQALVAITLGAPSDAQKVDGLREAYDETWFIHYNAPGFSVGEAKPPRAPGRREIGHGVLAQRALQAVMPSQEEFPYTVRAVSEILEMNGSSSMATVCGATLALMDAGVPIRKPVAGIAMGLIQE